MFRRRRPILILAAIGLFTAIFAIATNIATSTLGESVPAEWKPRIPLIAWSMVGISALLLIGLPIWQYLQEHPSTRPEASDLRTRAQMLAKVRATWMPLLDETLQDVVRMDLGLASNAALVDGPRTRLRQPGQAERALPPGTPIHAVFDDLAGELLILGAPGAGKTTMLLELARTLLDRAKRDPAHPIPVIFTLSTWAAQRPPIAAWLVDELSKRYDVPHKLGQAWVDAGALLPLLDGLDEVAADQRAACVVAINAYHAAHGPLRLVVCSRSEEYEALMIQLQLQGAVVIQPLGMNQIDAALVQAGDRLDGVRLAIRDDEVLQELATTPLLLSIMILAYRDHDSQMIASFNTVDARRGHMFTTYVEHMLDRPRLVVQYTPERTLYWLRRLAQGMVLHNLTLFYLEYLQPTWLTTGLQRRSYTISVALISGLLAGLLPGLAGSVLVGSAEGLLTGLVIAVVVVLITGIRSNYPQITIVEQLRWSWSDALSDLLSFTRTDLVFILGLVLVFELSVVFDVDIIRVLSLGFLGLVVIQVFLDLISGLVRGLKGEEIFIRSYPNQGIWRSARTALLGGLGVTLGGGLFFGLVFGLVVGLYSGVVSVPGGGLLFKLVSGLVGGMIVGIIIGLGIGLIVGLIRGFSVYGGRACIQHLVLRILLWRNGSAPWNYAAFLDYTADRILLRKVGGGYIFIHRMLMEYFAALEPEGTTDAP